MFKVNAANQANSKTPMVTGHIVQPWAFQLRQNELSQDSSLMLLELRWVHSITCLLLCEVKMWMNEMLEKFIV